MFVHCLCSFIRFFFSFSASSSSLASMTTSPRARLRGIGIAWTRRRESDDFNFSFSYFYIFKEARARPTRGWGFRMRWKKGCENFPKIEMNGKRRDVAGSVKGKRKVGAIKEIFWCIQIYTIVVKCFKDVLALLWRRRLKIMKIFSLDRR